MYKIDEDFSLSPSGRAKAEAEGAILTKLNEIEDYVSRGLEVTDKMIDDLEKAVQFKNDKFP